MAKSSKRSVANGSSSSSNNKNTKKKKMNKTGPEGVAMKAKAPKANVNPFESIWTRKKFDILGQKRKGETKRTGLARSTAIEKRKKTLLKEYEQSTKSSQFVDKRIGENDETIDDFGKAIMRSQRERQLNLKLSKKSKYNLSDGEDDDGFEGIDTLGGDDYEDDMLDEDDNDETYKRSDLGQHLNAHGMQSPGETDGADGGENRRKTKKEVMNEIIAKSKFYKAQKAKDKEEDCDLVDELDKNFTSLAHSEALLSLTEPNKRKALNALVNNSKSNEKSDKDSLSATPTMDKSVKEKPDEYDQLVRQMGFEICARPSDRLKTPEEIAQEERERLEELEELRQKRMTAAEDSSEEDDEDSEKPSEQKQRSVSGDDLGDSFSVDEETITKKGLIDLILERKDDEDSSGEDDDGEEDSDDSESSEDPDEGTGDDHKKDITLKDWEQSDDDDISAGSEDEDDEDEERAAEELDEIKGLNSRIHKKAKRNDSVESVKGDDDASDAKKIVVGEKMSKELEIPYIIEAPKTFEELCSLVDKRSNSDIILIINRIRKSNAIILAAENRKKVQVFYGVLLQYFAVLTNKKPLNVDLVNMLVKPLIEISMEIPYFAAICARRRIETTRKQFVESIKNAENCSWPSSKTLCLFRLWSMIFPCSDFRHPVMTPVVLLMCEYLMRCPITSGRDIAIGSFLCSMLLSVFKQSKKFCPEAIIFIQTLLLATTESKHISCEDSQLYHLMELKDLKPLVRINESVDKINALNFFKLIDMPEDSPFFTTDDFRASVLVTVVETIQGYINAYKDLNSFPEIFLPILKLLLEIAEQKNMPIVLRDKVKDVAELIKLKADEHHALRRPLKMRKQKPVPIRLLNPKFEENHIKGVDYDAELKKLKRLWKRECKGDVRELRKSNYVLLEVKEKERSLQEKARAEKYGRAKAFLQEQEHAFKSGQLGKGKKRSR
ncbi:unnamed protein product [Lathyrus sativus]|nr:unnamed protein product [Lathyrus sativus]